MNENTVGSNIISTTPPFTSQIYTPRRSGWEDKTNQAIKIYISYSESDQLAEKELEKHLAVLQQRGLIEHWNNQNIKPGEEKDKVIKKYLNAAQIIVFLVSVDFIASSEQYEKEVLPAIERLKSGNIQHVIPILIRDCDWSHTPFSHLQSLPRSQEPIYPSKDLDKTWNEIVKELRHLCEGFSNNHIDANKFVPAISNQPSTTIPTSDPDKALRTVTSTQKPEDAYTSTNTSISGTRSTLSEIRPKRYTHLEMLAENIVPILSLAFSPDGQYLASNSNNGIIKLWDMRTKSCSHNLKNYVNMTSAVAFSPDGRYLASGGDDGSIKLWNYKASKIEKALQGHGEWITSITFSADGQYLASGSDDGSIKIWNVPRMSRSKQIQGQGAVSRIAFAPNKQLVACAIYNQAVKLWDISMDQPQMFKELPSKASSLIFSPNGEYLAVGNENGSIEIRETRHWKLLQSLAKHIGKISCLAFHPDSSILASGGDDRDIQLWDVMTGREVQTLEKHTDQIESIVFSPDGQFIASGGRDTNIQLWESL